MKILVWIILLEVVTWSASKICVAIVIYKVNEHNNSNGINPLLPNGNIHSCILNLVWKKKEPLKKIPMSVAPMNR